MYIYENPDWPFFKFDESVVKPLEDALLEKEYFLDGIMSVVIDSKETSAAAIVDSLKDSWAIEGINLSETEIYSSIAKRLDIPFITNKTKSYYDGIVDVLLDAAQNHSKLTIDRILSWQKRIVAENPGVKKGTFRDDSVYDVSGSMKNTVIIYEAPAASEVNQMMDEFLEFVNGHSCSDSVMAAIAQYYFVAIHPFEDGNGRTGRIISDYILCRSREKLPYVFVSTEIKKKQKEYYSLLERVSKSSSMDITEWIVWFINRMIDGYDNAISKVQKSFKVKAYFERTREFDLNDRQLKFLKRALQEDLEGVITAKKYAAITSCHVDTANRDLKKLVSAGLIIKEEGGSKNTHYTIDL